MDIKKVEKSLRFRVAVDYVLLVIISLAIICGVCYEQHKLQKLRDEIAILNEFKSTINQIHFQITELTLAGELIPYSEKAFNEYHSRRLTLDSLLQDLKNYTLQSYSQYRIDSISQILEKKELYLIYINNLRSEQIYIQNKMEKQIPSVTSQVVESKRDEKSGLFRKKTNTISASITELQNLQNDYINQTKSHSAKQEAYADSLRQQNKILNQELQNLVLQLHFHIDDNIDNQVANISYIEQRILRTISFSMIIGCVLLIVSYFIIHKYVKQNLTYRRKLEQSIQQNNELLEMRKKIILTVSHDIRGPLNAISGSTELALSTREKKKRNVYLENIQQSCAHILHLVNALLNMYRLNEAKETVNLVSFDLHNLLERIAGNYRQQANNKGLLFVDNFVHSHKIVEGDVNRIEQIIENLLSNAIKFTSTGKITFSSRYHINRLYLKVSDTGKGMTKDEANRLFNPFERSNTNDNIEGFGLGLAITKGLVRLLDGTIKAKSTLGKGSTFMVSLPLPVSTETKEKRSLNNTQSSISLPPLKVLAIDDDPIQLSILLEMLERNNIPCNGCTTVQELINQMRKDKYDLILTDIQMTGTSGFDLLHLLRQSNIGNSQSIPIIAMTAGEDNPKSFFTDFGFADCIYKPFSMQELLLVIADVFNPDAIHLDRKKANFTALLSEVKNPIKLLNTFIEECHNNIKELTQNVKEDNRLQLREIVHRMFPVWKLLKIEQPLEDFRNLLHNESTSRELLDQEVTKINQLIETQIKEAETIKRRLEDEENTDC